jgi:hypothetical protein
MGTEMLNHTLRTMTVDVPEAVWLGEVVDTSHFRVPLCDCYPCEYEAVRGAAGSLQPRRLPCVYVGSATDSKSYLCFHEETATVYTRRWEDLLFDERCKVPGAEEDGSATQ